jgi:hypothetical protein
VSPPPAPRTSQEELLGTTTGIILMVIAAVVGLAVLIIPMCWAATPPDIRRLKAPWRPGKVHGALPAGDQRSVTPPRRDNRESGMAGPTGDTAVGQGHWPSDRLEDRDVSPQGNPHGKPSSWMLVAVVTAAFITGGLAIIAHAWWLFWACAGIVVLSIPAGKAIGIMDDTVAWGSTPAANSDPPQGPETDPGRNQPTPARETIH